MNKHILLGIDASISIATLHALLRISELIQQAAPQLRLTLVHVVPPAPPSISPFGLYVERSQSSETAIEQLFQVENLLHKASTFLEKQGIAPAQIETIVRKGVPTEEIAKVAKELQVDFVVVGSRGNSMQQRVRRFFTGSTSRKVLELAPCPVIIVTPPASQTTRSPNLVTWYQDAITHYLHEHSNDLTILTPPKVAHMFTPVNTETPGRKETAAAILALEQLAHNGTLCRRDTQGQMLYVND